MIKERQFEKEVVKNSVSPNVGLSVAEPVLSYVENLTENFRALLATSFGASKSKRVPE